MSPPPQAVAGREATAAAAIEAANAADPRTVTLRGETGPLELLHGRMVLGWVKRLRPQADELERLAALASHLRRWERPREAFPPGRAGYLRWRRAAAAHHAEEVGRILQASGYPPGAVSRVRTIVRKEGRRDDPAVQANEDARCLVFLEAQLDDTAASLGVEGIVRVVARTAAKMSAQGLTLVAEVPMSASGAELVRLALDARDGVSGYESSEGGR